MRKGTFEQTRNQPENDEQIQKKSVEVVMEKTKNYIGIKQAAQMVELIEGYKKDEMIAAI